MKEIKVDTAHLKKHAEKVNEYLNNLEKARKNIKIKVDILDSMWDGEASEAFKKAMKSDMQELKDLIKDLKEIYKFETNAIEKYQTCEEKVAKLVEEMNV